jgi:hypothetical protein
MEVTTTEGSRKGSAFFWIDSRAHIKDREYEKSICLKCRYYSNMIPCKGRAIINKDSNLARFTIQHTCAADTKDIDVCLVKASLKRSAETTQENLRQLYNAQMEEHEEIRGMLSFPEVESSMYKRRRLNLPVNPKNIKTTVEMMEDTENNPYSEIYLGHVEQNEEMAIVFGKKEQIDLVKAALVENPEACKTAFVDGTFGIVPQMEENKFEQLLIFQVNIK